MQDANVKRFVKSESVWVEGDTKYVGYARYDSNVTYSKLCATREEAEEFAQSSREVHEEEGSKKTGHLCLN